MGELAGPHAEAKAYDICPGAESDCLSDHAARTGDLPVRACAGTGVWHDRPVPGALATDVDSGRMTTGSQAHGVSLQSPEGLNRFMLRQQRAAWASLQGHMQKLELMTNAQGRSQAV